MKISKEEAIQELRNVNKFCNKEIFAGDFCHIPYSYFLNVYQYANEDNRKISELDGNLSTTIIVDPTISDKQKKMLLDMRGYNISDYEPYHQNYILAAERITDYFKEKGIDYYTADIIKEYCHGMHTAAKKVLTPLIEKNLDSPMMM